VTVRRSVGALAVAGALALAAAPGAWAATQAVTVQSAAFSPTTLDVLPGETVVWTNMSDRTHTVTSDAGAFGSGSLLPGSHFSWTFTAAGPFPAEIRAVNHLAQAFEAYNLTATHLRDRYLLDDTDHTLRATLRRLDREIVAQQRRMTPVGGSDSHTHHLRATTFVLSRSRTEAGIHEALLAGRVCVRSPEACSLEVRALGREASPSGWVTVGGAVRGEAALAQVRGDADDIDILVDGVSIHRDAPGVGAVKIPLVPGKCSVIRAKVGEGYSAPIYANCPFAGPS